MRDTAGSLGETISRQSSETITRRVVRSTRIRGEGDIWDRMSSDRVVLPGIQLRRLQADVQTFTSKDIRIGRALPVPTR